MARGQILTIPNQTAQLVTTLSREQKASLAILNPNDGVCYIKLNGPASTQVAAWDWKLPSQSYGQFPGPWESCGIFYLDQSGSGRTAEVNLYESDSDINIPAIIAIGRAVQSAGTTVDISQGAQPSNPPASTGRLWIDGTGQLHVLDSTGHDETYVDTTYPLAGDVTGTIPVTRVTTLSQTVNFSGRLQGPNGGFIQDYGPSPAGYLQISQLTVTPGNFACNAFSLNGNGTITGTLTVAGTTTITSDLVVHRNSALGYVWLGNNNQHYIGWDGSQYIMPGGLLNIQGGGLTAQGNIGASGQVSGGTAVFSAWAAIPTIYINSSAAAPYIQNAGAAIRYWSSNVHSFEGSLGGGYGQLNVGMITFPSADSGRVQFQNTGHAYLCGSGFFAVAGGTNNNSCTLYSNGNAGGIAGWQVISSKRFKDNLVEITDALGIISATNAYHFTTTPPVDIHPETKEEVRAPAYEAYGFIAEEWADVAPDVTSFDENGLARGMDYGQVTAILYQAFKDYVKETNGRLDKLESVTA